MARAYHGETDHGEILPFEAETGLLIPDMEGTLTGLGESGEEVDNTPLVFYRGGFYHYANNFSFPESGTYILRTAVGTTALLASRDGGETRQGVHGAGHRGVRERRDKR